MDRWIVRVIAGVGLGLLLVACGNGSLPAGDDGTAGETDPPVAPTETPGDDDELAELIAAAQAEGELTFYSTAAGEVNQYVADGFTEKYGIPVQFIRLTAPDLTQRFSSEATSGVYVADVFLMSDPSTDPNVGFFADTAQEGWTVPLAEAGIPGFPWDFPSTYLRETRAVMSILPWGIAYNTSIVSDPPAQWTEFDERYSNLITVPALASSNAYVQVFEVIYQAYGEEWFEGFVELGLDIAESGAPAMEALGAGEFGIAAPSLGNLVDGAQARGAPVEMVIPDVTTGVEMSLAITNPAHASHPNAARLFAHYIMSPEGNAVFSDIFGAFSVYDDEGLPSQYVSPPLVDAEVRERIFGLFGQQPPS